MNSIIARATLISLFLGLTVVTQGHTEDYYIYQTANGDLVISNKQPPLGSKVIKQLPGETDKEVPPAQEPGKTPPNVQTEGPPKPSKMLEFALTELWNCRQGKMLTNDAYKDIGGVEGAISRRAEEEFNRLSHEQKETAQRVLTRLVRVSAATEEGTDTRQRVRLSDFDPAGQEVVRTFADSRLLVTNRIEIKDEKTGGIEGEEIVEIGHEALIRSWRRLKDLLDRDRQFLLWRQRLEIALSDWERTERDAGTLLRGVPLAEARRSRKERGQDLNQREQEFIARSESAERQPKYWIAAAATIVVVIALAAFVWKLWDNLPQSQISKILVQSPEVVKATAAVTDRLEYSYTINVWLRTLVLTGRSNEAVEAARKIEDAGARSRALVSVVEGLTAGRETAGKAKSAIEEAQQVAKKITEETSKSEALANVAEGLAKLHLYRRARELVDLNNISAGDKLTAYTAILREYHIEHHPEQAKLFER